MPSGPSMQVPPWEGVGQGVVTAFPTVPLAPWATLAVPRGKLVTGVGGREGGAAAWLPLAALGSQA